MNLAAMLGDQEAKTVIAKSVSISHSHRPFRTSLHQLLQARVTHKLWSMLALVATVLGTWLFFQIVVPAETAAQHGRPAVFYSFPAIKLLYMMYFALHIYLIAVTALRTLAAISALSRFFSSPGSVIWISMFDPDHSGGFGSIGRFSLGLGCSQLS
jgi:hypothetical protein